MREFAVPSARRTLSAFLFILVTSIVLSLLPSIAGGSDAANFSAKDVTGKTINLAPLLKDGPVLIDFWMSYCNTCKNELSELDKLHRKYRDRGFHVLAVSQDTPKSLSGAKAVISQRKWAMSVLLDPNKEIGNRYNVRCYPTFYLIAQDGTIAYFAMGYMPGDEKALEERVVKLLTNGERTTADTTRGAGTPE